MPVSRYGASKPARTLVPRTVGVVVAVHWFRRDLRLHDNPALAAASTAGAVLPVVILDPALTQISPRRRQFFEHLVATLRAETDGTLVVCAGAPERVLPELVRRVGATEVHVTDDHTPYAHRRDTVVAAALAAVGARIVSTPGGYVTEPGSVVNDAGRPYTVFGPYFRTWVQTVAARAAPATASGVPEWVSVTAPAGAVEWVAPSPAAEDRWALPTTTAAGHWHGFRDGPLASYASTRDHPGSEGTSRLSAALRFGLISPSRILADLDLAVEDHRRFAAQIAWRDFHADVLARRPDAAWSNLDRRFDRLVVDTDATARRRFERWCSGRTGFSLVDAGMRELAATGWMHNRVRMVTASFLVKDLHLPWQWGARWFLRQLCDGDLASNNLSFQWVAGCGLDTAPYHRIFNPDTQAERFDPQRTYRDRWLTGSGADEVSPMLDHAVERRVALDRYAAVR